MSMHFTGSKLADGRTVSEHYQALKIPRDGDGKTGTRDRALAEIDRYLASRTIV